MSRVFLQTTNGLLAVLTIGLAGTSLLLGIDNPIYASAELPLLPSLDSNLRFMGGIGLGLGIALLWIIPSIERHTSLYRLIWLCALAGGIGRLVSITLVGWPPLPLILFTAIE